MPNTRTRPSPAPCGAPRTLLATAITTLVLSTAASAQAQSTSETAPTLGTVNVTAPKEQESATGPVRGYAATRSATATKTDTPLQETPQSVTVITADQIRDQGSPNLQEALRYAAGVRNELYGIDNRGDWFSLRGSEESTLLYNGLREPLTGYYGVVRTEPYNFERIEVLRGPSSIIAGQNDPGGVVNLVPKRPLDAPRREVGIRVGNDSLREVHADLTGPLNAEGTLLYRLVAVEKDSKTQIRFAQDDRTFVAPSLTFKPNAQDSFTVYAEYQKDFSQNTNAFLPLAGTLRPAPNGPIPRDLFAGEPDWDTYGGTRKRVGYAIDIGLGDQWRLSHQLRHDRVDGLMESMYFDWGLGLNGFRDAAGNPDPNGQYMDRPWYIYDDGLRLTTGEVLLKRDWQLGGVTHKLVFGMDATTMDTSLTSASGMGTPLNVYNPVYGTFARPSLGNATPTETRVRRQGWLLQDQMKFQNGLSVRAGVRHDKVRNTAVGGGTDRDSATSVNLGVVYEAAPGVSPYASYSESFNPVAGTDAFGQVFKPKQGEQVEVGVKWQSQTLPMQATASVYSLKEKNRLGSDPDNIGFSKQIGDSRVKGVELEGQARAGAWQYLASVTYTDARASATTWGGALDPDQQLEGIPKHMASFWAVRDFRDLGVPGLSLGAGARYVGRIGDGTGNVFVPSVTLFDAMAAWETGPWRFALNVNNLADEDYIAVCLARGDCWFGSRRKVILTADYRW
ncbi:TonB-dependent siderophore receptor [uncultured Hydrogenophaga sp.]|jgi:iron complex outermembrane receptor protein|uniref:TonB-dependent siderophore receptor n=1 Tax=uncultured Hydrogenophaga sp. TaxID=199683 RepID=UPI00258AF938|nr:TonB-dependent siderophore receptor [uncultured Hydrogenophaga sp.]